MRSKTIAQQMRDYLLTLQASSCERFAAFEDGKHFARDCWQQEEKLSGGGISAILEDGEVIEKGGVNFSHVRGERLPPAAGRENSTDQPFEALGVSFVIHPRSPMIPTSHANIRLFVSRSQKGEKVWWFGGGFDLTPYYPVVADIIYWHQQARNACDALGPHVYQRFKRWCDSYFYLQHRDEMRGVGGIFFDDVNSRNCSWSMQTCFDFVRRVGDTYVATYAEIMKRNVARSYTQRQRWFQLHRRSRYVEFNLLYDRGTLFGLQTGGRNESILMSMPPKVHWRYNWQPQEGSEEKQLDSYLRPRDWLALIEK